VTVRDHLTRHERDLVRLLVSERVYETTGRYAGRGTKPAEAPCVYCGTPTRSQWRACPEHLDLVAADPDYGERRAKYPDVHA